MALWVVSINDPSHLYKVTINEEGLHISNRLTDEHGWSYDGKSHSIKFDSIQRDAFIENGTFVVFIRENDNPINPALIKRTIAFIDSDLCERIVKAFNYALYVYRESNLRPIKQKFNLDS